MPKEGWPCAECAFALPWSEGYPHRDIWWGACGWTALPLPLGGFPLPFAQIGANRVDGPKDSTKKVCPQFQRKAPL